MPFDIILVVVVLVALMSGLPVAIVLMGVPILVALLASMAGEFDATLLLAIPSRLFGVVTNPVLQAIPIFVFMGLVLKETKIAENMLAAVQVVARGNSGGLLVSVSIVGMLLAATTGVVGASVVTLAVLALPQLLRSGVSPSLATGSVAAAGTLGQIIPPSIVLIVLGDQLSNAWQTMQLDAGEFAPDTISVSDLFAGAVVPGMLLTGLFVGYQIWKSWGAEALVQDQPEEGSNLFRTCFGFLLPVVLIVAVLGSILGGLATPSEAAAIGAVSALLIALISSGDQVSKATVTTGTIGLGAFGLVLILSFFADVDPSASDQSGTSLAALVVAVILVSTIVFSLMVAFISLACSGVLRIVLTEAVHLSSMIFFIVWGAAVFSLVFRGFGGDVRIEGLFSHLPGGVYGALFFVLLIIFVLGFFLEFLEICFVVVPLVAPVLLAIPMANGDAMNPIWLGVLLALVLQTSFLTPPFGVALFYLRSVTPSEVTTTQIYRGVAPFVVLQLLIVGIVMFFPQLATFLPRLLIGQ